MRGYKTNYIRFDENKNTIYMSPDIYVLLSSIYKKCRELRSKKGQIYTWKDSFAIYVKRRYNILLKGSPVIKQIYIKES